MDEEDKNSNSNFVRVFNFSDDVRKPGRTLSTVKIGDIYMTRLEIEPGVTTGNYYHKDTRLMFYVERGRVRVAMEQVNTKDKKDWVVEPKKHVVHVPEYNSLAIKNIDKDKAVVVFFSNNPLRSEDNVEYEVL